MTDEEADLLDGCSHYPDSSSIGAGGKPRPSHGQRLSLHFKITGC